MRSKATRVFRLSADHGCSPVWERQGRHYVNVDPIELDLSPNLRRRLSTWVATFEATYDRRRPTASGFRSEALAQAFAHEGGQLARALQAELGTVHVTYLLRGRVRAHRQR